MDYDLAKAWRRTDGMRLALSLNHLWEFVPADKASGPPPEAGSPHGLMMVPGHWRGGEVTNFVRATDGAAIATWKGRPVRDWPSAYYARTFTLPPERRRDAVVLHIENIKGTPSVFLNGQKIHAGDSDDNALWLPLEDGLDRDGENRLVIGVDGAASPTYRCGLFGNAWLRLASVYHIGEPRIVPDLAGRRLLVELPGRSPMEVKVDVTLTLPGRRPGDAPPWTVRTVVGRADSFAVPWPEGFAPELWTPDTPTLYEAHFFVEDAVGGTVDRFTRRFGFREFRVDQGRYWLNGKPVVLKLDTALANEWSPDWLLNPLAARRQMEALKRANLNGMYVGHYAPDAVYDLADELGVFLIRWGFMPGHAALDRLDAAGMERLETAVARLAANPALANHPSLIGVLVDVWYNFHAGTTNPQFVGRADAVRERRTLDADGRVVAAEGGDPNLSGIPAIKKQRLETIAALYRKHLPGLVCFTGGSGEVGPVYATHIYHTWGAPLAELRAFFERYRLQRERALFVGETTLPYVGAFYDLANFHGGGKSYMTENTVRFHGPRGYALDSTVTERPFHEKQPGGFFLNRQETVGQRRYGFKPDAYTSLVEEYLSATMVPWRYSGLNGVGAFGYVLGDHHAFASKPVAADAFRMPDDLTLPGYKPEALPWSNAVAPTYEPFGGEPDFRPTPLASELKRVMADVALFIGGDERDVFLQDHAYTEGEPLRRVVALVNDAPRDATGSLAVALLDDGGGQVYEVRRSVTVPASGDTTAVFDVPLPVTGERRDWRLRATFEGAGTAAIAARDEIALETFPAESLSALRPRVHGHADAPVRIGQNPLYLFDPEGVLAAKLTAAGVGFIPLPSLEKPPTDGVVVVGRDGLRRGTAKFDPVAAADAGGFCLLLEQSSEASPELMKARQREAFINDPRHPALAGFRDRDFRYWRGSHGPSPAFEQNGANHNWADNGNRNLLASHVFRRPAHGNYQALLVSGFDLFQTPLLEYRSARGGWIASQLELTDRLDVDPVATRLFNRLVRYLDVKVGTRPSGGVAVFAGDAGRSWLKQFGVTAEPLAELTPGTLAGLATLLVAAPDFGRLEQARDAVNDFACAGGTVVYLQVGGDFSPSWLPFPATLAVREGLRQAVARPDAAERSGPGSLFMRGWGNSELYFRDPFDVPAWDNLPSRAAATEPAVVAEMPAGRGRFVLVGVTPERFGDHPAAGKTARLLSSLLTAAGVSLADESRPFALREPARTLDLSELKWEFALDERDVGLKENWHKGEGGGTFLKGLIRDGVEVRVGQPFESFLGREYDGVVWYRIELEVSPELAGEREVYFVAGAIDDFDETWLNGVRIGATGRETPKWWETGRVYPIAPGLLRPGKNLLAIRVVDDKGVGGLVKLPLAVTNRRPSTPQGWKTPYPGGSARDYEYKPDIVRQY